MHPPVSFMWARPLTERCEPDPVTWGELVRACQHDTPQCASTVGAGPPRRQQADRDLMPITHGATAVPKRYSPAGPSSRYSLAKVTRRLRP